MDRKRYRMALMILVAAIIVVVNAVTIPLFLYGAFGSDAILDFSRLEWVLNVVLLGWVFLVVPNIPLVGMFLSAKQTNRRFLSFHTIAFAGIVVGGILFFMGEDSIFWISALIITQASGIASLILLWKQFGDKKKNTPKDNNLPHGTLQ